MLTPMLSDFNKNLDLNESDRSSIINYKIYCSNRAKTVECEKLLHQNGYHWSQSDDYIIRDNPHLFDGEQTYLDIDTNQKTFGGYLGKSEDNLTELIYPEDTIRIKQIIRLTPSYAPRKMDRTLESMTSYPYRFKTEEEFEKEFGNNWRDAVCHSWESPGMDELFGIDYPFYVDKNKESSDDLPEMATESEFEDFGDGEDYGGYFDDWTISWDMLTPNKPKVPNYEPKKIDKTLESLVIPKYPNRLLSESPWDVVIFRYNTKIGLVRTKKYIEQFGIFTYYLALTDTFPVDLYLVFRSTMSLRKNNVYEVTQRYYDSGDFQKSFPQTIICPSILHMDDNTEEADNLFNTHIFKLFPNYEPKHIDRSLDVSESINSKTRYNFLIFKFEDQNQFTEGQRILRKHDFTWRSDRDRIVQNDKDFPCYIFVQGKKGDDWDNHIYYDSENYLDGGSPFKTIMQRNGIGLEEICPKIFTIEDIPMVNRLFDYGKVPDYSPKRSERTLESNNDLHNAKEICVVMNDIKEFKDISDVCKSLGYPVGYDPTEFPHYLFVDLKDKTVSFINNRSKNLMDIIDDTDSRYVLHNVYKRRYTLNDLDLITRMLRDRKIIDTPSYNPKKIERTLESFENKMYDNAVFKVNDPRENTICQNELFKFGFNWEYQHELIIRSFDISEYPIYIFAETKRSDEPSKVFLLQHMTRSSMDNYGSPENYIQQCINEDGEKLCPIIFNYGDASYIELILKDGNKTPSYKPKKFDRTFESYLNPKRILYAFDMDDTLVYSKRFEEHVKPLLVKEEFLTPEIILNNKVDDIGVTIKDLKYEHGRIYLEDPKQTINISNNASWVRKGDRVYITQPDAYFLTEESMPVGVYKRIVDIYNEVENKSIITSRREKLRNQTESALNKLGITMPNCGLFMYPSNSLVFQAKWKALKLEELYNEGFNEIHYFDDNIKVLKRIKSYLKKVNINISLYKVNENNYRKI